MGELPGIVITGATGRMGQMLMRTVLESGKARLVGAIERPGHEMVGRDVGTLLGEGELGVRITDDPLEAMARAQAVIDFTAPAATVQFAEIAAQARAVHVIGTTGLMPDDLEKIRAAARHAVVVRAGNMSLGVNLLVQLTRKVAEALDAAAEVYCCPKLFHSFKHTVSFGGGHPQTGLVLKLDITENPDDAYSPDRAVMRLPVSGLTVNAVRSFHSASPETFGADALPVGFPMAASNGVAQ